MDKPQSDTPYKPLGRKLKELRVTANESLAEASGAVEIDVRKLASFELGQDRPTEDVLLLLLSHFNVKDEEAIKLWEVAGYSTSKIPAIQAIDDLANNQIQTDGQVLFTDVVDVVVNNYGVVMKFMQNSQSAQPITVAKVGMSREHAKSVLQVLQVTLAQTEKTQRRISASDNSSETTRQSPNG